MGKRRRKHVKVRRKHMPTRHRRPRSGPGHAAGPSKPGRVSRIIVGAAPYAGGTWVYNAIRRLADIAGVQYIAVDEPDSMWRPAYNAKLHLIKTCTLRRDMFPATAITVTRNLLDSVASAVQAKSPCLDNYFRNGLDDPKTREELDNFAALSYDWTRMAHIAIRYESLVEDKEWHVQWLGKMLFPRIEFNAALIADEVDELAEWVFTKGYQNLEPWFITDPWMLGVPVDGWKDVLEPDLVDFIKTTYVNWFARNGYEIEA